MSTLAAVETVETSAAPEYQTVWDTYNSEEEVYNALIQPLENIIAWRCRKAVQGRAMSSEFLGVFQDLFQETVMDLLKRLCNEYRQEPKEGGVKWIPNSWINSSLTDATRKVLGANPRGVAVWHEFEISKNSAKGFAKSFATGSQRAPIERLMKSLVDGGVVKEGEFSLEDLEIVTDWRSKMNTKAERQGKPAALRARLQEMTLDSLKDIIMQEEENTLEYIGEEK